MTRDGKANELDASFYVFSSCNTIGLLVHRRCIIHWQLLRIFLFCIFRCEYNTDWEGCSWTAVKNLGVPLWGDWMYFWNQVRNTWQTYCKKKCPPKPLCWIKSAWLRWLKFVYMFKVAIISLGKRSVRGCTLMYVPRRFSYICVPTGIIA